MKTIVALSALVLTALVASGCVSSGKYEQAVAQAEEANARLDKVQTQKAALEQEVKSLRDQKAKLIADAEFATSELQRLRDSRDKERGSADTRLRELERRSRDLAAQNRALRQEFDALKKQNESLKATVTRYQKALKEPPPSLSVAPAPVPAPGAPAAQPASPAVPAMPASPAAPQAGLSPVNVNTTSASDMVLFLGIPKDVADRVVANRPYKVKGELLARNVLPKATYDAIKDRISVVP